LKFPLLSKVGALCAVILCLMAALMSVQSLVQERQARQEEAQVNVASNLARSQTVLGPVLVRSCTETWVNGPSEGADQRPHTESKTRSIRLPAQRLQADVQVEMAPRYRGIFKVNGYVSRFKLQARWPDLAGLTPAAEHERGQVACEAPMLAVALSDARGIQVADLAVNGRAVPVQPGSGLKQQAIGLQARLDAELIKPGAPLDVTLKLEVAGTQSLAIVPVADTTVVKLDANWPHPAFGGRFLPSERHIGAQGFDATWRVTSLASTARQEWIKGAALCPALGQGEQPAHGVRPVSGGVDAGGCVESFSVSFIDPINPYVLSDRATKYGLLFVALTFVAVGLVEALRRLRVHPVQYLLVGAALAVFFLLLVSLSEHMAFPLAYAAASLACTALLSFYGAYVLQGARAGLAFGAGIGAMFATLYALLQMEQTALALGAILLFVVIAAIMVSTRKLDWYALTDQIRHDAQGQL
jgi:inner membrane protein